MSGFFGIGSDYELDAFEDQQRDHDGAHPVECNRCGKRGLWWVDTGARWRLMEGKSPHVCPPPDPRKEFSAVTE